MGVIIPGTIPTVGVPITKIYVAHTMDIPEVHIMYVPNVRICTEGSSSSNYEESMTFDKTLYRILSMQDDMKTLTFNGVPKNEFEQFLATAIKKTEMLGYNTSFDSLDEYLGTLGVTHGVC